MSIERPRLPSGAPEGSYFDEHAARDALAFFETHLRHFEDRFAGQPFIPLGWERDALIRLFGLRRPDGQRLIRRAFLYMARGNWKTAFDAGLALKLLLADGKAGQQVINAAKDRDQAGLLFRYAAQFVRSDPELSEVCEIVESSKRIVVPATGSFLWSIPADEKGAFGLHPGAVIFDEYHVADRALAGVLATAQGTREEPLTVVTTTAGQDITSICFEEYQYASKVQRGEIVDPAYLPMIFEAGEDDDPMDPATWKKANPVWDFAGPTFHEYIAAQAKRAREEPAFMPQFLTYHLNRWTRPENRWMDLRQWDASAGDVDEAALAGRVAYGGLDLSSTQDLTAFVLVFPMADGTYQVIPRAWCPEENLAQRVRRDRVPYQHFVDNGWLIPTGGNVVDYRAVRDEIIRLADRFEIREIGFDRWGATQMSLELQDAGLKVIPFGQGYASMSEPAKRVVSLVAAKRLVHGGNPLLRWAVGNAVAEMDAAENVKLSKVKSRERIDPAVALVMAIGRAVLYESEPQALGGIRWV